MADQLSRGATPNESKSLGELYPLEQERVRELLTQYRAIGPAGSFGAIMLADVLRRADQAVINGDVVSMLRLYEEMKGCE